VWVIHVFVGLRFACDDYLGSAILIEVILRQAVASVKSCQAIGLCPLSRRSQTRWIVNVPQANVDIYRLMRRLLIA
jgi:hypothetical protein